MMSFTIFLRRLGWHADGCRQIKRWAGVALWGGYYRVEPQSHFAVHEFFLERRP